MISQFNQPRGSTSQACTLHSPGYSLDLIEMRSRTKGLYAAGGSQGGSRLFTLSTGDGTLIVNILTANSTLKYKVEGFVV